MRIISMTLGNITTVVAAACLTYLPADQKWNRLVAYWFTGFQVRPAGLKDFCFQLTIVFRLSVSPCHWP